jgi:hypothetical protein
MCIETFKLTNFGHVDSGDRYWTRRWQLRWQGVLNDRILSPHHSHIIVSTLGP